MPVVSAAVTKSAPSPLHRTVITLFLCLALLLSGALYESKHVLGATAQIGSETFRLDVVRTGPDREKGLSGRDSWAADTGMLFVFDELDKHCIWMKDMKFFIDIVWLDEARNIVDFKERVSPDSYPELFCPRADDRYVIELPAGTLNRQKLPIGQAIPLMNF